MESVEKVGKNSQMRSFFTEDIIGESSEGCNGYYNSFQLNPS